ncbi:MAG: hemolysin family protein [Dehalococcoidia bacterium]|nr:hemolysin family protein [Dehalococcoidia bacterium]
MDASHWLAIAGIIAGALSLAASAATETALERASDVRIRALATRGDVRARMIAGNVGQPRHFLGPLTTARIASETIVIGLFGYLGALEYSPFPGVFGFALVGGFVASLVEMTVGLIVARRPEYAALQLARVARTVGLIFTVPAFLLGLPSRMLARSLRPLTRDIDTDILSLVEHEEATGGVEEQEQRMIRGIIGLDDQTAREIMVPRIDIAAVDIEGTMADVAAIVNERGYSRVPIYRETIDDIVGIVYAKDVLRAITSGGRERRLQDLSREPFFIPESKKLDELLTEMQAMRMHLAIVVDEYGGTAGLVTIEDLLEEIVGEIEDEYDVAKPSMEVISEEEVVLDAGMPTDVLNDLFNYEVDSDDFDTVGGFLIHQLGRLPSVGDEVRVDGLAIRVLSMSGRRVRRLRIMRQRQEEPEGATVH